MELPDGFPKTEEIAPDFSSFKVEERRPNGNVTSAMKTRIQSLLLALGLIGFTGLHADTPGTNPFSSMVIFGDSISDSGNNAAAIGAQTQTVTDNSYIPTFPYAPGTNYCNGDV